MNVPTIQDIKEWEGKVVLVRAGLNVPLDNSGAVADSFRIDRVLPTIAHLYEQDAKVVIIAHLGRDKEATLAPVHQAINSVIPCTFLEGIFRDDHEDALKRSMQEIAHHQGPGVWLLDNVRQTAREQANDEALAQIVSEHADVYVNEAFSVSHREHMSLSALPRAMKCAVAGFACAEEIEQLALAIDPPAHSIAVVGGNKIATKLPMIRSCLAKYETVLVGGALANTLYAHQGYEVGQSVYEDTRDEDIAADIDALLQHKALYLPALVVCQTEDGDRVSKHIQDVLPSDIIYDSAPESLLEIEAALSRAPLVVWNGPLGYYEGGYIEGTQRLLELVAQSSTQSIVGGGNTVDAVRDMGYEEDIFFLSTGGGAMVEYLTLGSLPTLRELHIS